MFTTGGSKEAQVLQLNSKNKINLMKLGLKNRLIPETILSHGPRKRVCTVKSDKVISSFFFLELVGEMPAKRFL